MYEKELRTAISAVKKANEFLKNSNDIKINNYKENFSDYATEHDIAVEKLIIKHIKESFPDDLILAEETDKGLEKKGRIWIIDPIDGTRNFANRMPNFCTTIAFYDKNEIVIGVTYWHSLNELYTCMRGLGVYLNEERLVMNNPDSNLKSSLVTTGFSYDRKIENDLKRLHRVYSNCTDIMRFGAAALDLCNVANGRLGGYYERHLKPWDVAAGILFVEEMGGFVSNYNGGNVDLFSLDIDIVVSKNEKIHKKLLELM